MRAHEIPESTGGESGWTGSSISNTERAMSGAAGTLLGLWGLRHGGVGGVIGAIAGGALLARAATGHSLVPTTRAERALASRQGWRSAAVAEERVIINRPRAELYAFWRNFSNLPQVMPHLKRVDVLDSMRSHWVMALPMGKEIEWISAVIDDRPDERIAWKAEAESQVANSGWVEFRDAPGGEGTELRAQVAYEPPGGEIGQMLAKLWPQSPDAMLQENLRTFKSRVESGDIALSPAGVILPGGQ